MPDICEDGLSAVPVSAGVVFVCGIAGSCCRKSCAGFHTICAAAKEGAKRGGLTSSDRRASFPTGWKWTIHLPGRKPKTGVSAYRVIAICAAKAAIENAIRIRAEKKPTTQ